MIYTPERSALILISLLGILLSLLQWALKQYILAGESGKISVTPGKNIDRWVKGLLAIIALSIYFFVLDSTDYSLVKWFWLILFLLVKGFDVFMERWYLKGSKDYIVSLIILLIGLMYIWIFI